MYYFAYGSNMNFEQIKKRCPGARFLTKAKLNGYKFVYDGYSVSRNCAVANIVKSERDSVEGAVFEIDGECLKNLDHYEGYPGSYKREQLVVNDEDDKSYKAIVYLRSPLPIGKPSDEYRDIILQGAKDCGLSPIYIKDFLEA